MESILTSIKKLLGIAERDEGFDTDIIFHINSVFRILKRMGVGPAKGFAIEDSSTTWSEFLGDTDDTLEDVKTYIYLKVKIIFDPPTNSAHLEAMKESIKEFEWTLNFEAETTVDYEEVED